MSEILPPEANRELNEAEATYFLEALEELEPLLGISDIAGGEEVEFDLGGQQVTSVSKDSEATFDVAGKRLLIERRFLGMDLPEEGLTENVTWVVRVFDWGDSEEAAGPSLDVFSAMKEGGVAGYATYQRCYLVEDPETHVLHQVSPSELDDGTLEALRQEDSSARRIEILIDSLDARDARRKELEALTGIDDGTVFTPDKMYDVVGLLKAIPR